MLCSEDVTHHTTNGHFAFVSEEYHSSENQASMVHGLALGMRQSFWNNVENNRECGELRIIQKKSGQNVENSNKITDMYNVLNTYNEDTESESVEAEDPDNKETTLRQPALNTSTGLL